MNYKINLIFSLALLCSSSVFAQKSLIKKANKNFDNYNYSDAAKLYEKAISKGYDDKLAYLNLADAHYLNSNYTEAASWYGALAKKDETSFDAEHAHRYAQSLKSIGDYDTSDKWMLKLMKAGELRGSMFENNLDYIRKINEMSDRFKIENMDINSEGSDFAPSFHIEALVFSSARDSNIMKKEVHGWNKKRFLNLYTASDSSRETLGSVQKFSDELNTRAHESSTAFSKDGNTVYFTRNNSKNNSFSRDNEGVSRLQLYKSTFKNGEWANIEPLPFNNKKYSVAHPTLNAAEDKLYFASDMPGTFGKSDIWEVAINADGSYGEPKNLGDKINTEGKETFPFVTSDNVLYFSSDGHPGLGGLDVFATGLEKEPYIVNVGEPVNSVFDDFSFIMNAETKKGYFASDRKGGKGSDDIYAFVETKSIDLECGSMVSGIVKDKNSDAAIPNAKVMLLGTANEVLAEGVADANGFFELSSNCEKVDYIVVGSKDAYENDQNTFANNGEYNVKDIVLSLMPVVKGAPVGSDLAKYLNIAPIYFDLDKSFIRNDASIILDKVVAYMREYPAAKIEVRSHTDSRANKTYNTSLSQRRAEETVAYMVGKGIDVSRIIGKGFGETNLTNDCEDAVKCSEEQHQQNRRSEFIVLE